jgi:hypothetical protein
MDVLRLDPTTYLPDTLVEGLSSKIWTERFSEAGDFQFTSPQIDPVRNLIPQGSLLSLRDSDEVMVVETHTVKREKGVPTLTTVGRTFETFTENRSAVGEENQEPWIPLKQYTAAQIASYLLWNYLVNSTGQDPSRDGVTKAVQDAVAGIVVTDSSTFVDSVQDWTLKPGEIYQQLRDFLTLRGLGVRNIRPTGSTGNVVTFDTSGTVSRGTVSSVSTPDISALRTDVYNGVDRTKDQDDVEPVIFTYSAGHIDNPQYLFSIRDLKNLAMVSSSLGNMDVWPGTGLTPPSTIPAGLARRILYVDGGRMETGGDEDVFSASVVQKALVELSKHNRAAAFDGAVSLDSPYKYGEHFGLGDAVSLMGEYGLETSMTVAEFVRTEDHDGDRGYPTLILSGE